MDEWKAAPYNRKNLGTQQKTSSKNHHYLGFLALKFPENTEHSFVSFLKNFVKNICVINNKTYSEVYFSE